MLKQRRGRVEKKEGLAEKRKGEEQAGISLPDEGVICQ